MGGTGASWAWRDRDTLRTAKHQAEGKGRGAGWAKESCRSQEEEDHLEAGLEQELA